MSLREELNKESVAHLDLAGFCLVSGDIRVRDVLAQMREEGRNICLIVEEERLIGVFTDRDVLTKVATQPESWDQPIRHFMTPEPVTVKDDCSAAEALWLMDDRHFRTLPVVDEAGKILGNLTYSAVIDYLAALFPVEVLNRPSRPEQFPRRVEGG